MDSEALLDKVVAWCTLCGGRYGKAEIEGRECCPGCGSRGVPCDPMEDILPWINWHELRILAIWAGNYAATISEEANDPVSTVQAIARRLERQFPDLTPLTLAGELRQLAEKTGIRGEIHSDLHKPERLLPVNGPGAVPEPRFPMVKALAKGQDHG